MKINKWTLGLAAAGVVSLSSVAQAEEAAHQVLTAVSSTTLSGYVSTSAIWNLGTSAKSAAGRPGALPFRAYDGATKQDSFNLDVVNVTISKALDESEWAAGYKVETLYGPDANAIGTQASGFGADFAIKQAYVNLRAPLGNGLELKVGVWDTPIGYEVFNAGDNPNYSRSFGYLMEPTTYTGILASYKVADFLSIWTGVANSLAGGVAIAGGGAAGSVAGTESHKSYMAGFSLTAPDSLGFLSGSTLSAGAITHASNGAAGNVVNYYAGATMKTGLEGLLVGASYDYQGRSGNAASASFYANAFGAYLSYQITEKAKTALRAEYANGSSTPFIGAPFGSAAINATGSNTELVGVTGTLDYKLWENVISRVEMRWDHSASGGPGIYGGGGTAALHKNTISLAMNLIYKF